MKKITRKEGLTTKNFLCLQNRYTKIYLKISFGRIE